MKLLTVVVSQTTLLSGQTLIKNDILILERNVVHINCTNQLPQRVAQGKN